MRGVLRAWLSDTRALAAQALAASLREAMDAIQPQSIRLGLDDIAALRGVLCEASLGGFQGLEGLQTALCREENV